MDDDRKIRFSQWSVGGMKCINFDLSVTQRVLLPGGTFDKLFVFGELVSEGTFVSLTKEPGFVCSTLIV